MKYVFLALWFSIFSVVILPGLIVYIAPASVPDKNSGTPLEIAVYKHMTGELVDMPVDTYVAGVVAGEMPAGFEAEALKAQAVAARSFAYEKMQTGAGAESHYGADICDDPSHCQAFRQLDDFAFPGEREKYAEAAESTSGLVLVYDDMIAKAVYHSSSGARTENSSDVWGGDNIPYLVSVVNDEPENAGLVAKPVTLRRAEIVETVSGQYDGFELGGASLFDCIEVIGFTEAGRAEMLRVGNIKIKATEFRRLFGLRSTDFYIAARDEDSILVTCTGYGHGVGMSQWGAESLARGGAGYAEILKHYYPGAVLENLFTHY
jgi:stage II sporulation protein D